MSSICAVSGSPTPAPAPVSAAPKKDRDGDYDNNRPDTAATGSANPNVGQNVNIKA